MVTNLRLTKVQTETTYSLRLEKTDFVVKVIDNGRRGGRKTQVFRGSLESNEELSSTYNQVEYEKVLKVFKQLESV